MKNKHTKLLQITAIAALALAVVPSAQAIPTLTIFDGTTTITIQDNLAGDAHAASGVVLWVGSIGVWTINIDTGFTKPAIGSSTNPYMDLNFSGLSSGAGTLVLTFSDDGFTYTGPLTDSWGGTAAGTVHNSILVNGQSVIEQGPLGPGAFSSSANGAFNLIPADTVSLVVAINHSGAGQLTTGDKELKIPEGGATLSLLGGAMLGLGLLRRKMSRKA